MQVIRKEEGCPRLILENIAEIPILFLKFMLRLHSQDKKMISEPNRERKHTFACQIAL